MYLEISNWDINKCCLTSIQSSAANPSIAGSSFALPPLDYVAGDILALRFMVGRDDAILPIKDQQWDSLMRLNPHWEQVAREAQENEFAPDFFVDDLREFLEFTVNSGRDMDAVTFDTFLAFFKIPMPSANTSLCPRGFWIGTPSRADIKSFSDLHDKFNKDGLDGFFHALEKSNGGIEFHCRYSVRGYSDIALLAIYLTHKQGKWFTKCENCGKFFSPSRAGEKYCNRVFSSGGERTCKDEAKYQKQLLRERASESGKIYKSVNTMMAARVGNAKNQQQEDFLREEMFRFRDCAREWRAQIKSGTRTEEEYISFLNSFKRRNKKPAPGAADTRDGYKGQ